MRVFQRVGGKEMKRYIDLGCKKNLRTLVLRICIARARYADIMCGFSFRSNPSKSLELWVGGMDCLGAPEMGLCRGS